MNDEESPELRAGRPTDDVSGPLVVPELGTDIAEFPERDVTPAPIEVRELAAACVRFVTTRYGVPLDFTSETLSVLDQYVKDAREELDSRPETADLLAASVGAYLGEVLRQTFGGAWFAVGDYSAWRVDFARVFLSFNPLGMAREALLLETSDGWHTHMQLDPAERDAVLARLDALPQVGVEEYYAPTTRFDVVSMVFDALRARLVEQGLGDTVFGPDDYRA